MDNSLNEQTSIIVICYLIAEAYKVVFKKKHHKYIPIVVGVVGGMLSTLTFLLNKNSSDASIIASVASGIIYGLASVGANQVIKNIIKERKN